MLASHISQGSLGSEHLGKACGGENNSHSGLKLQLLSHSMFTAVNPTFWELLLGVAHPVQGLPCQSITAQIEPEILARGQNRLGLLDSLPAATQESGLVAV